MQRWVALGRRYRFASWATALLWIAVTVTAVAPIWDVPDCTEAAPCSWDWTGMLQGALMASEVVWLIRRPELALPGGLFAIAGVVVTPDNPNAVSWWVLFVTTAVATVLVPTLRLRARREQARLAATWSTTVAGMPPQGRTIPASLSGMLTIQLLVVAGCIGAVLFSHARYTQHLAHGHSFTMKVVAHKDDGFLVQGMHRGHRVSVETDDSSGYRIGSLVTVLADDGWKRLAADGWDPLPWDILGALAAFAGLTTMTRAWRIRRDTLAIAGPHPVVELESFTNWEEVLLVGVHETPLARIRCRLARRRAVVLVAEPSEATSGPLVDDDEWWEEPEFTDEPQAGVRTTVHGALAIGRAPTIVADLGGVDMIGRPTGLLRLPHRKTGIAVTPVEELLTRVEAPKVNPAGLETAGPVQSFAPEGSTWAANLLALAAYLAFGAFMLHQQDVDVLLVVAFGVFGVGTVTHMVCYQLAWRGVLDVEGVHLRTLWRTIDVPWTAIREVTGTDLPYLVLENDELIRLGKPTSKRLGWLAPPLREFSEAIAFLLEYDTLRPRAALDRPLKRGRALAASALALSAGVALMFASWWLAH